MPGIYLIVRYIKERSKDEGWAIVYGSDDREARRNCYKKASEYKAKIKSIT